MYALPFILLWNLNYERLLYWNKFGTPPAVLDRLGDYRAAMTYWWFDEDSAADLADAMKAGRALPKKPSEVKYDEVFKN